MEKLASSNSLRHLLVGFIVLCFYKTISGQSKFNFEWVQGGLFKSSVVSYNGINFKYNRNYDTIQDVRHWFLQGSNICDSSGRLYLASNGYNVLDSNGNYIDGLDSIGGRLFMEKNDGFASYCQYSIFLPFENGIYYFVNNSVSDAYWNFYLANPQAKPLFDELLYCKIDMNGNGGAGKVLKREVKIIEHDTLSKTQMMACLHANGKDWWLLKQAQAENKVHTFLFTKDSVFNKGIQQFAIPVFSESDNGGQSMFSQDGKKYASTNRGTGKIFVADFDRCTGVLSNPMVYDVDTLSAHNPNDSTMKDFYTEGLAFSPNGRFIYVYMYFNIQQLDLWDNNPNTRWSVVAELDTTWDAFQSYSNMQLGPDNKLYVGNWGSVYCKQMSYFNNPNAKGLASDFCPRCLRFPNYGITRPPTMPNYDLGPTGQPCWPVSQSEIEESAAADELLVYPNPTHSRLYVQTASNKERRLFNSRGQLVQRTKGNEVDVSALPAGVYWLRVGNRVRKVVVE
jgi:hypothetical protein